LKARSVTTKTEVMVIVLVNLQIAVVYFNAGRPLFYMSLHLFQQHDFIRQFHLDVVKLMRLLSKYANCASLFS